MHDRLVVVRQSADVDDIPGVAGVIIRRRSGRSSLADWRQAAAAGRAGLPVVVVRRRRQSVPVDLHVGVAIRAVLLVAPPEDVEQFVEQDRWNLRRWEYSSC